MKRKVQREVYTLEEVKQFEKIDPRVSEQYVPIFSSELIQILKPEFNLERACKFQTGGSGHYIDLVNSKGDEIRCYNSYDRTCAFRLTLKSDKYSIDLGLERVIHRGTTAKELKENIENNKQVLLDSVKNTKTLLLNFKNTKIKPETAKVISDAIFYDVMNKEGFQEYNNYVDILIDKGVSIDAYINQSIDKFISGDYTVTINGKKRKARGISSVLAKVNAEQRIIKAIITQFPSYFL